MNSEWLWLTAYHPRLGREGYAAWLWMMFDVRSRSHMAEVLGRALFLNQAN